MASFAVQVHANYSLEAGDMNGKGFHVGLDAEGEFHLE